MGFTNVGSMPVDTRSMDRGSDEAMASLHAGVIEVLPCDSTIEQSGEAVK